MVLACVIWSNSQGLFNKDCPVYDTIMVHILITELRGARRSSGQSQASLAAKLNVSPQMIKRLESGIGSVPLLVKARQRWISI